MKGYKGYLIDLDGTMYIGKERIDAASQFVKKLKKKDIPYLFVTNNSTKRPEQVAEKLQQFDIPATSDQVFTTGMATAGYIEDQDKNASIYYIGEEGLKYALEQKKFRFEKENPDYVVVGLDRQITYEKLAIGALAVRNGATFLSTNSDVCLPTEKGFFPGNGSLTSVISVSTGIQPTFIGKPEPIIMEQALEAIGLKKEDALMIGDNYHTDILAGIKSGMDTLLVFTGVSTKESIKTFQDQPTYMINSLEEWMEYL